MESWQHWHQWAGELSSENLPLVDGYLLIVEGSDKEIHTHTHTQSFLFLFWDISWAMSILCVVVVGGGETQSIPHAKQALCRQRSAISPTAQDSHCSTTWMTLLPVAVLIWQAD